MPGNVYFPTGDALFSDYWRVVVTVPKSQQNWVYSVFLGVLELLTYTNAWWENGETTTQEAAAIFEQIFWSIQPLPYDVGDIKWSASPIAPVDTNWLLCDGTSYVRTDYPDLFTAIGTAYGSADGTHFNVPDLQGRVVVNAGSGAGLTPRALAQNFGEETHQLTTAELASHAHTDLGHSHNIPSFLLTGTSVPPPLDAGTEVPLSLTPTTIGNANIQATGGDAAHNNIQPSLVFVAYILSAL
jgi:microcystin-dependent protein